MKTVSKIDRPAHRTVFVLFGILPLTLFLACGKYESVGAGNSHENDGKNDWKSGAFDDQDAGNSGDAGLMEPGQEVCDGWDNNGNNQIDELTGGDPCTVNGGAEGTTQCISGDLICMICTPGETRSAECGCNDEQIDICSDQGHWMEGSCDSCEEPVETCECTPGEQRMQRCDNCTGEDCGATCVGSMWLCGEDCRWQQTSQCEGQIAHCDRDEIFVEPCGKCGTRRRVCDGCFWHDEGCVEEQACLPGATKTVPCYDSQCAAGQVSEITCNDQCEWSEPAECSGCPIGHITEIEEECVPGYQCGSKLMQALCIAQAPIEICGGEKTLELGEYGTPMVIRACEIECMPGQVEGCTLSDGRAGMKVICGDDCRLLDTPEPCGASSSSCVPGTEVSNTVPCGCGVSYTENKTCKASGDGWNTTTVGRGACPECREGATQNANCTTSQGQCGNATLRCTNECNWPSVNSVQCIASGNGCTPGQQETQQVSCGANTCGRTYTKSRSCLSNGCGWSSWQEDRSSCPQCTAGQTQTTSQLCVPGIPACGYVQRECTSSCNWRELSCPQCD